MRDEIGTNTHIYTLPVCAYVHNTYTCMLSHGLEVGFALLHISTDLLLDCPGVCMQVCLDCPGGTVGLYVRLSWG